tara:strand:- start:7352 stop:8425 length:1074 start_codon:yes stop_codon:yes gene_type:complete
MATVLGLVLWSGGAHLGAPADPAEPYAAARPEWYFLFLFQWLKYFPAGWEVIGAQVIPGLVLALVAAMPVIGGWKYGHRFNVGVATALLAGIVMLTWQARVQDSTDPEFVSAQAEAEVMAERSSELAAALSGIPVEGGLAMLRADPLTQGPRIFEANCSQCHRFEGHDGLGGQPSDPASASDLAGFGTRAWLAGLLDPERVATDEYFGGTDHVNGRMSRFVRRGVARFSPEARSNLTKVIMAVSAEGSLPLQVEQDAVQQAEIEEGRALMSSEEINCTRCHTFRDQTDGDVGPVLTGWGSRDWMLGMLHDPTEERFYGGDNDRMPSFGTEKILTEEEMGLVVDWLRSDWVRQDSQGH